MNHAKHTPGPWCVYGRSVIDAKTGGLIAAPAGGETSPEREANARLIAAAPELLEALEYALPYLQACVPSPRNGLNNDCTPDINCVDRARAAIAKATGGAA